MNRPLRVCALAAAALTLASCGTEPRPLVTPGTGSAEASGARVTSLDIAFDKSVLTARDAAAVTDYALVLTTRNCAVGGSALAGKVETTIKLAVKLHNICDYDLRLELGAAGKVALRGTLTVQRSEMVGQARLARGLMVARVVGDDAADDVDLGVSVTTAEVATDATTQRAYALAGDACKIAAAYELGTDKGVVTFRRVEIMDQAALEAFARRAGAKACHEAAATSLRLVYSYADGGSKEVYRGPSQSRSTALQPTNEAPKVVKATLLRRYELGGPAVERSQAVATAASAAAG